MAALALVVAAVAGCGLGPGEDTGDATLWVTRDYGSQVLVDRPDLVVNESSTAMRLVDQNAELETAYGGEFVQAVNGIAGQTEAGRRSDWFFSVNGIVAGRGSAQFPVAEGDLVWWDYRDWSDAMEVGAVVGAFPRPFSGGYDNRDWGVEIDCRGEKQACGMVRKQLEGEGVSLTSRPENMIIRVGRWDELVGTPEGRRINKGPASSGVFARWSAGLTGTPAGEQPSPWRLTGLDQEGRDRLDFGPEAGLVAALRQGEKAPVWLVTGGTDEAVEWAAAALTPRDLERRYAAVVSDGRVFSLPLR